jgi:predicted heme/steroid binding protein/uncharacterized membrane protein
MGKVGNMEQRRFTISELREFDGKEGRPAYVAVKGKVYDVSNSPLWRTGKHPGTHVAGLDLTISITNAPHSEEVLKKFKVVGELVQEEYVRQRLVRRLQKMHLHPMLVHFPMAYSIVVPLLSFLSILFHESSFEAASYYMLLLGFLAAPVGGASGIFSWKVTYEGRMTRVFYRKIVLTTMLTLVITACFVWRILSPRILMENSSLSYVYLTLTVSFVPITLLLGHYGGKIVYS